MRKADQRKLEAAWRAKLAASGFRDLESADRDGPLSDRGNLHAVTETDAAHESLSQRIENGRAYVAWADGVLHRHRFRSGLERAIWARHAAGEGIRAIAAALDITYHDARDTLQTIKTRVGKQGNQGRQAKTWESNKLARYYRRLSMPAAIALAAVLLKTPMRSSTSR